MFIHIVPCILATEPCSLLDLTINELDLTLKGGTDLALCQIYRNRQYLVACRRDVEWGAEGILINSPQTVREFTVVTRWAVADKHVATHRVRYLVPDDYDDEQDMVSSSLPRMLMKSLPTDSRVEQWLDVFVERVVDTFDENGYITERNEVVALTRSSRRNYMGNPRFNKRPRGNDAFDLRRGAELPC